MSGEATVLDWPAASPGHTRPELDDAEQALSCLAAFSDQDLERLFDAGPSAPGGASFDTSHLVNLGRDLLAQYVDVIGGFIADAFGRPDASHWAAEVNAARAAMAALADATQDDALGQCVAQLGPLLDDAAPGKGRSRSRYLERVREWVNAFAGMLAPREADRLTQLVRVPSRGSPMMLRLAEIPGIGARRLERLALAGLHEGQRLIASDPEDVALVAGLSLALATRVVEEARQFVHDEHLRALAELEDRARWLLSQPFDRGASDIRGCARGALSQLTSLCSLLAGLEDA